ncbi:MAG: hypothetical protein ACYCX4_00850 [Bacillota bacterium]
MYGLKHRYPISGGECIGVVGGGIAGIALARQLLLQAGMFGKEIKVKLFNSENCNYCGGLITSRASQTLQDLYRWDIGRDVILDRFEECIYVNKAGTIPVQFKEPLYSTFRVGKFGATGFDAHLRHRLLEGIDDLNSGSLEVIEPSVVTGINCPQRTLGQKGKIYYRTTQYGDSVADVDILAISTGLRSLGGQVTSTLCEQVGYAPPATIEASVAELDLGNMHHRLSHRLLVANGILPGCTVALIPKGPSWITVVSLGRCISGEELDELFSYPPIKKLTGIVQPLKKLRCGHICPARVHTGPARHFYGDGWIALGDLTGYGRVLKDGLFASLAGAYFAGVTFFKYGTTGESLHRFYHRPLAQLGDNNRVGMWLYHLDHRCSSSLCFSGIVTKAASWEAAKNGRGEIHQALGGLQAGSMPYLKIAGMLARGIGKYLIFRPFTQVKWPVPLIPFLRKFAYKPLSRGDGR